MSARTARYFATAGLIAAAHLVQAATLGLRTTDPAGSEDTVLVPVHLAVQPGEAVAGLQFDLHFDADALRFEEVAIGSSARDAEKSTHTNLLRPGVLRVIIVGFNRNAMETGPVADAHFSAIAPAAATTTVAMSDAILSDPYGTPVSVAIAPNTAVLEPSGGTLRVQMATGSTAPARPGDPYGSYRALFTALLCVAAAIAWSRHKPRKRRRR